MPSTGGSRDNEGSSEHLSRVVLGLKGHWTIRGSHEDIGGGDRHLSTDVDGILCSWIVESLGLMGVGEGLVEDNCGGGGGVGDGDNGGEFGLPLVP